MNELEALLERSALEADAAKALALLTEDCFDGARADAYLASVDYPARLAAWKAASWTRS